MQNIVVSFWTAAKIWVIRIRHLPDKYRKFSYISVHQTDQQNSQICNKFYTSSSQHREREQLTHRIAVSTQASVDDFRRHVLQRSCHQQTTANFRQQPHRHVKCRSQSVPHAISGTSSNWSRTSTDAFDRQNMTSYQCSIVTLGLDGTIAELQAVEIHRTVIPSNKKTNYYYYNCLTARCLGLPGWAGTRKVKPIWILLKQQTVSGSGISWDICKSALRYRQITMPATHHSVFFRPDALPVAQPTVSKHWRQSTRKRTRRKTQQGIDRAATDRSSS